MTIRPALFIAPMTVAHAYPDSLYRIGRYSSETDRGLALLEESDRSQTSGNELLIPEGVCDVGTADFLWPQVECRGRGMGVTHLKSQRTLDLRWNGSSYDRVTASAAFELRDGSNVSDLTVEGNDILHGDNSCCIGWATLGEPGSGYRTNVLRRVEVLGQSWGLYLWAAESSSRITCYDCKFTASNLPVGLLNSSSTTAQYCYLYNCQIFGTVTISGYQGGSVTNIGSAINVTDVADSSGLFKITTASAHGMYTGSLVTIAGTGTAADGVQSVTKVDNTSFTIIGVSYASGWVSGGTATPQGYGGTFGAVVRDGLLYAYNTYCELTGGYQNGSAGLRCCGITDNFNSQPPGGSTAGYIEVFNWTNRFTNALASYQKDIDIRYTDTIYHGGASINSSRVASVYSIYDPNSHVTKAGN